MPKVVPITHPQPPLVQAQMTTTHHQSKIDHSTNISSLQSIPQIHEVQDQQQTRQIQQQKQYVDLSNQVKSGQSQQHHPINVAHQPLPQSLEFQPQMMPEIQQQYIPNSRSPSLDAYPHIQTNNPVTSQSFPTRSERYE